MILIKKKTLFIKRNGKWINVRLETIGNGGGLKGFLHFLKELVACLAGKHTYIHTFNTPNMTTHVEYKYCRKESL